MSTSLSSKISSWVLAILLVVSVAMVVTLYSGGYHMEGTNKAYEMTGVYLYWTYALIGLTLLTTLFFSVLGFINTLRTNPKRGMVNLGSIILLIILLGITYSIGNGDPASMPSINEDSKEFLTEGWLKYADMVLYSSYTLVVAILVSVIWGSVSSFIKK